MLIPHTTNRELPGILLKKAILAAIFMHVLKVLNKIISSDKIQRFFKKLFIIIKCVVCSSHVEFLQEHISTSKIKLGTHNHTFKQMTNSNKGR